MANTASGRAPAATETRRATGADVDAIAASLSAAFDGYPLTEWVVRRDRRRDAARRLYFEAFLRQGLEDGEVLCDSQRQSAAIWFPPDGWGSGVATVLARVPVLARIIGWRHLLSRLAQLRRLADHHPEAPHWYLEVLGTHPAAQGGGLASSLVDAGLARARAAGSGAYLLTSNRDVIPFYARFGFGLRDEVRIPHGPTIWSLWLAR